MFVLEIYTAAGEYIGRSLKENAEVAIEIAGNNTRDGNIVILAGADSDGLQIVQDLIKKDSAQRAALDANGRDIETLSGQLSQSVSDNNTKDAEVLGKAQRIAALESVLAERAENIQLLEDRLIEAEKKLRKKNPNE